MSKYSNMRICRGCKKSAEPCEHIDNCNLCLMGRIDEEGNEVYIVGIRDVDSLCKRDEV